LIFGVHCDGIISNRKGYGEIVGNSIVSLDRGSCKDPGDRLIGYCEGHSVIKQPDANMSSRYFQKKQVLEYEQTEEPAHC